MISSLFISAPLEFGWLCVRSQLPPSGVMTVDSAKTSPPVPRPNAKRHVQETGLCLFRDRLRERVKHRALDSQFIAIAKAPCQAFTAAASNFFLRQDARQLFHADADAKVSENSGGRARRDSLRAAPI